MINLYPDQTALLERLEGCLLHSGSAVCCAPTGAGKTVMAAAKVLRSQRAGERVLFLVHRRELVWQAVRTLREVGVEPGVIIAGAGVDTTKRMYVGQVQSLVNRTEFDFGFSELHFDEAHHVRALSWEKIMARWPKAKRVGWTATPERRDGKGLGGIFSNLIVGASTADLIGSGRLSDYRLWRPAEDDSDKPTSKVRIGKAAEHWDLTGGRQTIFFGKNREHSLKVAAALRARGVRAEHVDGDTPRERRESLISGFRAGRITCLCNVDLISEGFDCPSAWCVMLGRPTDSLTIYLQQVGRALRAEEGKVALVLDLCGNSRRHGFPCAPRRWRLGGKGERESAEAGLVSAPSLRLCVCGQYYRSAMAACPNCGAVPAPGQVVREADLKMEQVRGVATEVAPAVPPEEFAPPRRAVRVRGGKASRIAQAMKDWHKRSG